MKRLLVVPLVITAALFVAPDGGGGADHSYPGCTITPAGNFQCNPGGPGK